MENCVCVCVRVCAEDWRWCGFVFCERVIDYYILYISTLLSFSLFAQGFHESSICVICHQWNILVWLHVVFIRKRFYLKACLFCDVNHKSSCKEWWSHRIFQARNLKWYSLYKRWYEVGVKFNSIVARVHLGYFEVVKMIHETEHFR